MRSRKSTRSETQAPTVDLYHILAFHQLAALLVNQTGLPELCERILQASIEITKADFGNVQLIDESGQLLIVVQSGFTKDFVDYFNSLPPGHAASVPR
jgi:hypothetical protein